jgi:hypothetical protein
MTRKMTACLILILAVWGCRSNEIRLNVTFDHLSGLAKEDRIIFEGNRIGSVQAVKYNSDGSYTVQVSIDKGFLHAVTQYSHFSIVEDPERSEHKAVRVLLTKQGGTPLESGTTVAGVSAESDFVLRLQKDLESGFSFFKEQIEKFERDVQQYPESEEYNNLKKSLEDLAAEIQRKEKQARERIKHEWLPRIQRELDKLKEKLKQYGREDELAPLEKEVERIRKI